MVKYFLLNFLLLFTANSFSQTISPDSLVLHLNFNGNANDISGNNYNGIINGAALTSDRNNNPNSAYYFDGVNNNSITIKNIDKLDGPLSAFTILITLRPQDVNALFDPPNVNGFGLYEFFTWHRFSADSTNSFLNGKLRAYITSPDDQAGGWTNLMNSITSWCTNSNPNQVSFSYNKDTTSIIDTWFTYAIVFDNGRTKVFHNCQKVYDNNLPFPTVSELCGLGPMQISLGNVPQGVRPFGYRPFKGKMDDLQVYSRALSANEIAIYSNTLCVYEPPKINPKINIEYDRCFPNKVTFKDITNLQGETILGRKWSFSSSDTLTDSIFTRTFNAVGVYPLKFELKIDNITTKTIFDTVRITSVAGLRFLSLPTSNLKVCENSFVNLKADGATYYQWKPCTFLNDCTIQNPISNPNADQVYTVIGKNVNGCIDSLNLRVEIIKDNTVINIPNTFTPNGDGVNDKFGVFSNNALNEYSFSLFNRFGQLVFNSNTQQNKWDGKYQSIPQPIGSYIWLLNYNSYLGCPVIQKKGMVNLLR